MHPVGSHFIGGFDGTAVTKPLKNLIRKFHLGGVILFARNIESPAQVRSLIARIQKLAPHPLFVGVDQEGGRVARMKGPFTPIPPMSVVGKFYRDTGKIKPVVELGRVMGRELSACGYNWDFAPVVDVHSNPKNPVIGDRSLGPDPRAVARSAEALIQGLHAEGVLSCAKHFPGHGATSVDSHLDLPVLKSPGRLLWKRDLFPYRRLIKEGIIKTLMTAHVRYPAFDPEHCATFSRAILTELLRGRIGYRGLIVSDDLFMKAISDRFDIPSAVIRFFEAGGDIALVCKEPEVQTEAIIRVTELAGKDRFLRDHLQKSRRRIERIRRRFCRPKALPSLSVIGCREHREVVEALTPIFV